MIANKEVAGRIIKDYHNELLGLGENTNTVYQVRRMLDAFGISLSDFIKFADGEETFNEIEIVIEDFESNNVAFYDTVFSRSQLEEALYSFVVNKGLEVPKEKRNYVKNDDDLDLFLKNSTDDTNSKYYSILDFSEGAKEFRYLLRIKTQGKTCNSLKAFDRLREKEKSL